MKDHQQTEPPVTLGAGPAEGGNRTPDPRITNGGDFGLSANDFGRSGGVGDTLREHPALRLLPMPVGEVGDSLSDFMRERREACVGKILNRVAGACAQGAEFSMADLTRMLHEAWTGGGSAMADGIAARDSERSLEVMRAMEVEADRFRVRQIARQHFILPWPEDAGEAGLMAALVAPFSNAESLTDGEGAR
jgi:hypothetical protein